MSAAVYLGTECSESLVLFPGLPVQNKTRVLFCTGKPGNEASESP